MSQNFFLISDYQIFSKIWSFPSYQETFMKQEASWSDSSAV